MGDLIVDESVERGNLDAITTLLECLERGLDRTEHIFTNLQNLAGRAARRDGPDEPDDSPTG